MAVEKIPIPVNYLRISVTDRCDLNCSYCGANHRIDYAPPEEILSFEEILEVINAATELGIDRIRLTGGEPLIRKELPKLVGMISQNCDISDLSLTTNGTLLEKYAEELKDNGLHRVNVSLDTLSRERFKSLTGKDKLHPVLDGIKRAVEVGLTPVKINTVLMRGFNQDEIVEIANLASEDELIPRFIELMPVGTDRWEELYLPADQAVSKLETKIGLTPTQTTKGNGPANYYNTANGIIGFISPLSHKFCSKCNRIRMTAQGELRPCIAYNSHIPLKEALRRKGSEQEIKENLKGLIKETIAKKPNGHPWDGGIKTDSEMSILGG